MMGTRHRSVDGLIARALVIGGAACVIWSGYAAVRPALYAYAHRHAIARLDEAGSRPARTAPAGAARTPAPVFARGAFVGTIAIPRLDVHAAIAQGDDQGTLARAVGHLPDTPWPWQSGNTALAGHRDGLFRPLRHIRAGDLIRVSTSRGQFLYRVHDTRIVSPNAVWVLNASPRRTLTLITCYPFTYIGHAPKRFIVQAQAVQAGSDGPVSEPQGRT